MEKKLSDISAQGDKKPIDLGSKKAKNPKGIKLQKSKQSFKKRGANVSAVRDIAGAKQVSFAYVKGQKFNPPPFLGNLIRVSVSGLLIILLVNVVNVYYKGKQIEAQVTEAAKEGYSLLFDAGQSATKIQFSEATIAFDEALDNFSKAEKDLGFIGSGFYSQNNEISLAADALLGGGKDFALAGTYFIQALEEFNKLPVYFFAKNSLEKTAVDSASLADVLENGLDNTDKAIKYIADASEKIQKIEEELLPTEMRARVSLAKVKIADISKSLTTISEHFPALLKLMGDRLPHRYLILLQNNNELRPSGGFIGSYAIVDVNDGVIEKVEVHDSYDIDGSYGGVIEPPDEFKTFTSNWRFRDSNYSSDFPLSAAKARWFLQKQGGPSVDTVIAINQGLLKDLLEISGPVQVGKFGELNSENYELLLSYVIETKAFGPEDPKHILKVFVPAFKDAILKQKNLPQVSAKLYKALQQKHIMFYSADPEIEDFFDAMDVSGRVHPAAENEDYLSVIHISHGGTKSDKFIEETIDHNTDIAEDGTLIDTLKIVRKHTWTDATYYQWAKILKAYGFTDISQQGIDILGRGKNAVATRIYVPDGAILLESSDKSLVTKYDKELNRSYFYVDLSASAGESVTLKIKYKLPYKLDFSEPATYRLFVDKQPGSRGSIFNKSMSSAPKVLNLASYPENFATNLVYDRYFAGVWKLIK